MKLQINKDILMEGLNNVSKALSTRNIIPILNGIKFEVNSDGLILTATDNEVSIKHVIDRKDIKSIEEEGTLIIIGKYINEIIRKLPSGIIKIEDLDNTKAIISTDNSHYNLNCYNLDDFPTIDFSPQDNNIKLDTKVFKDIIGKTSYAASTQESRPLLTGINIKIKDNIFECCATDSYRLSKVKLNISEVSKEEVNVVIPSSKVNELIKLLDDDDKELELHVFSNKVMFKYKNFYFQSSLLNGSYPNTENLIPTSFELNVELDTKEFYNVIDRASIFAQTKEKNIIELEIKNNDIIVTSNSPEVGKVEEKMNCKNLDDKELKISFSSKYMMDALKTIKENKICMCFNGEIKPIIIKENKNNNFIQLILPIKTF